MPNAARERRTESAPVLLPWGTQAGAMPREEGEDAIALWLGGGVLLLAWTGLALLLTACGAGRAAGLVPPSG